MAQQTRLYFQNANAPYTPATIRGAWDQTASAVTKYLGKASSGAATTIGIAETNATNNWDVLLGRWISDPITHDQTITGTVYMIMGALESNAAANDFFHIHIFATAGDSDTVRATLLANSIGATEFTTTSAKSLSFSASLSSSALTAGDRIVVEIGYQAQNTVTTSRTGTINYGNTGSIDLGGTGDTNVTSRPGWIQFPGNLFKSTGVYNRRRPPVLNRKHSLAQDLIIDIPMFEGGGSKLLETVRNKQLSLGGDYTWEKGPTSAPGHSMGLRNYYDYTANTGFVLPYRWTREWKNKVTVAFWINNFGQRSGDGAFLDNQWGGVHGGIQFYVSGTSNNIQLRSGSSTTENSLVQVGLTQGAWTFIVFTADWNGASGTQIAYKNGVQNNSNSMTVGADAPGDDIYVLSALNHQSSTPVVISQVRVWKRVLTAKEVRSLYRNSWQIYRDALTDSPSSFFLAKAPAAGPTTITKTVTAKARILSTGTTKTVTAKARIKQAAVTKTVTAKAYIVTATAQTTSTISQSSDDAEQDASGLTMTLDSSDLELCYVEDWPGQQLVGLRFNSIALRQNALITNAYIRFVVDEDWTGTNIVTIKGQAADNPGTFTTSSNDIGSRSTTTASVLWDHGTNLGSVTGNTFDTVDIHPIVKELVDRAGWASGNSMVFIISGSGTNRRTMESYDKAGGTPAVLHIEYAISNVTQTVTAKARIKATQTKTVTAKARIKQAPITQTVTAKARIKQAAVTKTVTAKARIKGSGVTKTITAKASIAVATSRLKDNFTDNSIASIWTKALSGDQAQVLEQNARIEITHNNTVQYNTLSTVLPYDIVGDSVYVRVLDVGNQSLTSHSVIFFLRKLNDDNNKVFFVISGNFISAYKVVSGVQTQVGSSVAYSSTDHAWLRFREASGTLYWDTSADLSSWANQWTLVNPFSTTQFEIAIQTGAWQVEASGSYAYFDNVNVPEITKTVTAKARIKVSGNNKTVTAKARIKNYVTQTVTAKARVKNTVTKGVVVAASYSETNADAYPYISNGDALSNGSTFTAINGTLDSAKFYLKKIGSPTGSGYVKIYAHTGTYGTSGKPTGSALATSDAYDVSTIPTSPTLITFTFSGANRISLTDGTYYAVAFEYTGGSAGVNAVAIGVDNSSPTASGNTFNTTNLSSWSSYSGTDTPFYLYESNALYAKARIKSSGVTKTVSAKARIKKVDNTATVTAKARIKKVVTQTITAKARIKVLNNTQTVTAKARIFGTGITKTISALSRIKNTITKTVTAKARVKVADNNKTVSVKARMLSTGVTKTVSAKANITAALTTYTQTVTAKARILSTGIIKTVTAKARIFNTYTKTITAKARIKQIDNTATVTAKARVKVLDNIKQVSAQARIKKLITRTITALARIKNYITQTVTARTRIKKIVTQTVTVKARVKNTLTQTVTSKARVKSTGLTKTISARARIKKTITIAPRYGLDFDGINDDLNIAGPFPIGAKWSIEFTLKWGYSGNVPSDKGLLTTGGKQDSGPGLYIKANPDGTFSIYDFGVGYINSVTTRTFIQDQVYKLYFASDDVTKNVYFGVDGSVETIPYVGTHWGYGTTNMRLGEGYAGYIDGTFGDFRFSNNIRHTSNYTPVDTFETDVNTTILLQMDEGAGSTAEDSSGNNYDGTLDAVTPPTWVEFGVTGIQAKARIKQVAVTQTITARARIFSPGTTKTVTARARVKVLDNTQTISTKARIKSTGVTNSISAKARIKVNQEKQIFAKARIHNTYTKTISAKAHIKYLKAVTISAKARIRVPTPGVAGVFHGTKLGPVLNDVDDKNLIWFQEINFNWINQQGAKQLGQMIILSPTNPGKGKVFGVEVSE